MNYTANATHWQIGNIVIHDADAKRAEMLMVVFGYDKRTGECITRYRTPNTLSGGFPDKKRYHNFIECLHDPKQFGIECEQPKEEAQTC